MHYVWYSQQATEEHPIITNRPLRNGCISQQDGECVDHIIQSRCLSYSGDSQPVSEERPITLKRPLGNGGCMGRQGTLNIESQV